MADKLNLEQVQKSISIVSYIDSLDKIQIPEDAIIELKTKLVAQLKTLVIPLAQDIKLLTETENKIMEVFNDDVSGDIYDLLEVTHYIKNYISYSKNYNFKKEQSIEIIAKSMIELLKKISELNLIKIRPRQLTLEEGEYKLTEEEIKALESKASRLILIYKNYIEDGRMSYGKVMAGKINQMADTQEKYEIINNKFFELTGEYVLDKIKYDKEEKMGEQIETTTTQ